VIRRAFDQFEMQAAEELAKAAQTYLDHPWIINRNAMRRCLEQFQKARSNNLGRVDL